MHIRTWQRAKPEGLILNGHFIPKPKAVDEVIIDYGVITPFPAGTRIFTTKVVDFRLTRNAGAGVSASTQAGVDIAQVGVNTDVGVVFKKMMGDGWDIERLETQIVQPNLIYLEKCPESPQVAD